MNLVQKLPIGFGFVCMLMLSSCSKEDVQTPQPQITGVNQSSNLRGGSWIDVLPQMPSTTGTLGLGVYAPGWRKIYDQLPAGPQLLPSGTSNFKYLWGNLNSPWKKPLPPIAGVPSTASFLTIGAIPTNDQWSNAAIGEAKLRHLKPGKKYVITCYVASSIASESEAYPRVIMMQVSKCISDIMPKGDCILNGSGAILVEEQGVWSKQEIYFDATNAEMAVYFRAFASNLDGKTGYFNVFVDNNSIKQLN
ncbi:hypothetical protein [Dyadobacter crusticola]|uniref:hypothetical protein n=1 Tax=Dyadobacter crusticola TaxID=292407 RepID=UPI000A9208D4|nr:hypothetical protein [Dyadobacter crusticola]